MRVQKTSTRHFVVTVHLTISISFDILIHPLYTPNKASNANAFLNVMYLSLLSSTSLSNTTHYKIKDKVIQSIQINTVETYT